MYILPVVPVYYLNERRLNVEERNGFKIGDFVIDTGYFSSLQDHKLKVVEISTGGFIDVMDMTAPDRESTWCYNETGAKFLKPFPNSVEQESSHKYKIGDEFIMSGGSRCSIIEISSDQSRMFKYRINKLGDGDERDFNWADYELDSWEQLEPETTGNISNGDIKLYGTKETPNKFKAGDKVRYIGGVGSYRCDEYTISKYIEEYDKWLCTTTWCTLTFDEDELELVTPSKEEDNKEGGLYSNAEPSPSICFDSSGDFTTSPSYDFAEWKPNIIKPREDTIFNKLKGLL